MLFKKKKNEDLENINLLASLLVCYPAMSKVTLDPKEKGLTMDFTMTEPPTDLEQFEEKRKFIIDSLQLYNQLEATQGGKCGISYNNCALHVFRDWETLSNEEINLLVTLVVDKFGEVLQKDKNIGLESEAAYQHHDTINPRIIRLRQNSVTNRLVGVREEGRVMVFDK